MSLRPSIKTALMGNRNYSTIHFTVSKPVGMKEVKNAYETNYKEKYSFNF